jgi:plastocyanin
MLRGLSLAALTAALLLAFGGTALADADVTIGDDGLDPETIRVDIREAIVWTNATDGDVSLVGRGPDWESGPIEPGATFSIEITQAGTYEYGSADDSLSGEIIVGAAGGGEASEEPSEAAGGEEASEEAVDEVDEEVTPDEEALPQTGVAPAVPGALSVLLIGFGGGLLHVTQPLRRRRTS